MFLQWVLPTISWLCYSIVPTAEVEKLRFTELKALDLSQFQLLAQLVFQLGLAQLPTAGQGDAGWHFHRNNLSPHGEVRGIGQERELSRCTKKAQGCSSPGTWDRIASQASRGTRRVDAAKGQIQVVSVVPPE